MLVSEAAEGNSERHLWGMKVECHRAVGEKICEAGSKSCRCMLRLKTKVRRLYDIANVLTSLGLITKVENPTNSMRKPVFTYTGPFIEFEALQSKFQALESNLNYETRLASSLQFCLSFDQTMFHPVV